MGAKNGRGPKQRGDRYERELAAAFNDHLFGGRPVVQRAALSGGGRIAQHMGQPGGPMPGGADLTGTPDLFVEAKRTERLNIRDALRQAEKNIQTTGAPDKGVVITRKDREATLDSIVAMRLADFLVMYEAYLRHEGWLRDDT